MDDILEFGKGFTVALAVFFIAVAIVLALVRAACNTPEVKDMERVKAQCASMGGVYGGGHCYVDGEEVAP